MSEEAVRKAIIIQLKTEMMKIDWWDEVQEDVQTRLGWVIDHVTDIGPLFARSFMMLFRWEFDRRRIGGETIKNPYAGFVSTLMGMRISEEAYQCGILPTRSLLDLYDYVAPNDSDVAACLYLCHKIEIFEQMGALQHSPEQMKTTPSEMAKVIRDLGKPKRQRPSQKGTPLANEEKFTWGFHKDEEDD
jgi:hypothetical protein